MENTLNPETKNKHDSKLSENTDEYLLVNELKQLCDEHEKEVKPQKSAEVLHELGLTYLERSALSHNNDNMMMDKLIKSACLFNAAIARKPENVENIKKDLNKLCCQVLIKANAQLVNADLIAQSDVIKSDIEAMRDMVRQKLKTIQSSKKKKRKEIEQEKEKIHDIRELQNDITMAYTNIMAKLLCYCQRVMGDAPCKFALVGMGSLARKEITPYSDFEHIIVLEENSEQRSDYQNILHYFRWLSVIFQIVLINLQETIVASVDIPSLRWFYDGITTRGVCFDGMMPHACKFPRGRIDPTEKKPYATELISSVNEMLKYLSADEDIKNGYHLKDILTKVCYIGGDEALFNHFQKKTFALLKEQSYEEKKESIKKMLIEDLDNFATRSKLLDLSSKTFDIKKDFYRSSTLFISALGQLNNVEASSCFDISEALKEKNIINNDVKHYQMYAVALGCELRLKWYMERKRQDDKIESKDDNHDSIQILSDMMKTSDIIKYFQVTYALQCDISKQLDLKKIHFYADPKLLNCKLYYRFGELEKLNNFLASYNKTEYDQTTRLYSTKKIMQEFEQETKQQQNLKRDTMITNNNEKKMKEAMFDLGEWLETQQNYDEAIEVFQMSLKIIEKHEIQTNKEILEKKSEVLHSIGRCLRHMEKPNEANDYFENALDIDKKISLDHSEDRNIARRLNNIGMCLMKMQKHDEAITYLQSALGIDEKASQDHSVDKHIAEKLNNIGMCLLDMQNPDEAITYLKRALDINKKASHDPSEDKRIGKILNNIGMCLMDMQKLDEAITYLQRALDINQKTLLDPSEDKDIATTLNNIGMCLMYVQKHDEAITYLQKALDIAEKTSLDQSVDKHIAERLNNIGMCLRNMQNPDEAITYLQRALDINQKASHDPSKDKDIAIRQNNIGLCLMDMQKHDEAITYLQKALDIAEKILHDPIVDKNFATTLNNIGICLMDMQKHDEAITYLQKALDIAEKKTLDPSVDKRIAKTLNKIGICLKVLQKHDEAITYLERAKEIDEKISLDRSVD